MLKLKKRGGDERVCCDSCNAEKPECEGVEAYVWGCHRSTCDYNIGQACADELQSGDARIQPCFAAETMKRKQRDEDRKELL